MDFPDCEAEVQLLEQEYQDIFFDETPFNETALDKNSYLIVGRRGSGKTALAHYFSFQRRYEGARLIYAPKPEIYQEVLVKLSRESGILDDVAVHNLVEVWRMAVWYLIFRELELSWPSSEGVIPPPEKANNPTNWLKRFFTWWSKVIGPDDQQPGADERLGSAEFIKLQKEVVAIAKVKPVIVAIDTLERGDTSSHDALLALAALVQFASSFCLEFGHRNIMLKVFIPGEAFPQLIESAILSPAKVLWNPPVFLLWKSKDILRLIGWRLFRFLNAQKKLKDESRVSIDWDNYKSVLNGMWIPYFGNVIENRRKLPEHTWSYVLRHTQMRPRQMILMCNAIARGSIRRGNFPSFSSRDIIEGVHETEDFLASEILSSFQRVYPNVSQLVPALSGMPMYFRAKELDARAHRARAGWIGTDYSMNNVRDIAAQTGIVGRVARFAKEAKYIDAEFEYSRFNRLHLDDDDACVIHPMFYKRLQTKFNVEARVMPFYGEQDDVFDLE